MNRLTVIVPVYNGEKFLDRCFNSLIMQTNKNFDVIMVDDGSTDNSINIAKSYLDKLNLKIFSQSNRGVSSARNFGISKANSELVTFLDCDDEYYPNFVDCMLKNFTDTDITIGLYETIIETDFVNDGDSKYLLNISREGNTSILISGMIQNLMNGYIWRCVFKKNIILNEKISFKKYYCSEDLLFLLEYCSKVMKYKVVIDSKTKYLYKYHENNLSVTRNYIPYLTHEIYNLKKSILAVIDKSDVLITQTEREKILLESLISIFYNYSRLNEKIIKKVRLIRIERKKFSLKKNVIKTFDFKGKIILYSMKFRLEYLVLLLLKIKSITFKNMRSKKNGK